MSIFSKTLKNNYQTYINRQYKHSATKSEKICLQCCVNSSQFEFRTKKICCKTFNLYFFHKNVVFLLF